MDRRPIRVLFVDDDEEDADLARAALEHTCVDVEYDMIISEHGEHAIDLLRHPKYDIVLLDYTLPRKNGLEVLEHIRKNPTLEKLPVIFLCGIEAPAVKEKALGLGANAFFEKPFDFKSFMETFREICHEWFIPIAEGDAV